jgi:hypothetical protein
MIMDTSTNPVFRSFREDNQTYCRLLSQVADNLISLVPSRFADEDIFELEKLLNELYAVAYMENWSLELQNAILEALGRASELNYLIQKTDAYLDSSFFKMLKQFSSILYMISAHVEYSQNKNRNMEVGSLEK